MDWKSGVIVCWSVLVALPGFIAFFWQWNDRRKNKYGPPLLAQIRKMRNEQPHNGWIPIQIYFRNDGIATIIVKRVTIKYGWKLFKANHSSNDRPDFPSFEGASTTCEVNLTVRPLLTPMGNGELTSGRALFFISSKSQQTRSVPIEMCFEYQSTSGTARKRRICVTSEPIEIPTEDIANA